jgi:hypothetical protein
LQSLPALLISIIAAVYAFCHCFTMIPDVELPMARGFIRPISCLDLHQGYVDGLNDPEVNRYLEVRRKR